jgi:hypothetical protein
MKSSYTTIRILLALAVSAGGAATFATEKAETAHLAFVTEYVRELASIEDIRESGEKEFKQDEKTNVSSSIIHSSTLFQLELGSQISMLKTMHLKPPFEDLIPNITGMYEHKVALWHRMSEIGTAFVGGPKPNVDYGKLAAEMPQIRAELDYTDHTLFDATPLVFATLIDMKADSKNRANHLIITKAERAKLIDYLNTSFGAKLDQKNQNYTVSSAIVLRTYLLKDYKSSDDPWE